MTRTLQNYKLKYYLYIYALYAFIHIHAFIQIWSAGFFTGFYAEVLIWLLDLLQFAIFIVNGISLSLIEKAMNLCE